jgi:hypothetical protein
MQVKCQRQHLFTITTIPIAIVAFTSGLSRTFASLAYL